MQSHMSRKTRKRRSPIEHVNGTIMSAGDGWKVIHVYGDPFERGYAHGYLLRKEMSEIPRILKFVVKHELEVSKYEEYSRLCKDTVKPIIQRHFPEFYEEMKGMVRGAKCPSINIDTIIEWNCVLSMFSHFESDEHFKGDRCSAFIATGDATADGKIVMAHNTHTDFVSAKTQNIIQYMTPSKGTPFAMQCSPGFIASGTDWFLCANGMIGCECTIGDTKDKPSFGFPYFCRIRTAMQYGNSIEDYIRIMLDQNAGDYACSWMFGNTQTNEIALLELGKTRHSIKRTYNGVYYGMNSAMDPVVRLLDTNDADIYDIRTSSGSRNSRLDYLLNTKFYGRIDRIVAKEILADHYDSHTNKIQRSSRGICNHCEMVDEDVEWDYSYPYGCTDGKVIDSTYAGKWMFEARFGSSCGRVFHANKYIERHPAFKSWKDILPNFYAYPWTTIHMSGVNSEESTHS